MLKKIIRSTIPVFLFLSTNLSSFAFTKYMPIEPITPGIASIPEFIKSILDIMIKVGIPVATIFIIWSGFSFITAQGDEGKLRKAKSGLFWASIGLAVLLGAWLIANAIVGTITQLGGPVNTSN